jgi:large subunit ribosomal protein L24
VSRTRRTPEQRRRVALRHEGWADGHARPLDIRSGDTVMVLTGRDAGKRGTVERILVDEQRIVVSGVNVLKRHTRAGVRGNVQGGIVDFDAPVAYSNVMLVCPRCDKPTRIGKTVDSGGQRVSVCKRCGEIIQRSKA